MGQIFFCNDDLEKKQHIILELKQRNKTLILTNNNLIAENQQYIHSINRLVNMYNNCDNCNSQKKKN